MTTSGATVPTNEPKCDHICLKDDGHVERGEPHFYGYELPSPRRRDAEYAAIRDDLPENFWVVHIWDQEGHRPGSVDVADRKRIIEGVLAAAERMRR